MDFSEEEIQEFIQDALELFDNAESEFLKIEKSNFKMGESYNLIFNSLHSLKGSLGMFNFLDQMKEIHKLEDQFKALESVETLSADLIDSFLESLSNIRDSITNEDSAGQNESTPSQEEISIPQKDQALSEKVLESENNVASEDAGLLNDSSEKSKNGDEYGLCKVLIVDDDDFFRSALEGFLTEKKYVVVQATTAQEALDTIKDDMDIQAIICDYHMPNNKGTFVVDFINTIKVRIPIVMVSNEAQRADLIQIAKSNPFTFHEKSEGFEVLYQSLRKALKERVRELIHSYYSS